MAHLTLQLGAAIVMPFNAPRTLAGGRGHWRARAIREAAALSAGLERLAWSGFADRARQPGLRSVASIANNRKAASR